MIVQLLMPSRKWLKLIKPCKLFRMDEVMSFGNWENSKRITHIRLKEYMNLNAHKLGFKKLRKFSRSWHVPMLRRCCFDLIYYLRKLNIGGRLPAKEWRSLVLLLLGIVLRKSFWTSIFQRMFIIVRRLNSWS